ncbi:MAG TPA: hypothetical protein VM533_19850 [Fimbriiglobus sp.]|jgi:septal ring factor EnvC (AmiA/AmiB activator)|nr:hypothetical protein [Fimbriiglobus sp.]
MRVALLVVGVVNLALVCMVAAQNHHLAEAVRARPPVEREVRPAVAVPDADADAEAKRAATARELQRELAAVKAELTALRTAVVALDTKTGKGSEELRADVRAAAARADQVAKVLERAGNKPDAPPTDAKQLETLTAELRRLNEQFRRVIDFAGVR